MRRAVHIAVTVVAVLLLVRPFDCFAGAMTAKAAACCAKGKCLPTRAADDCCKSTVPSGRQMLESRPDQSNLVPDFAAADALGATLLPQPFLCITSDSNRASSSPPGSPPGSRHNLPLLI